MSQPVVTVNIRNVAVGGAGVGEVVAQDMGDDLLGITAFVPYAANGELVSARVIDHKKRFLNAQLIEVERPSPERITPECKYFTICGGCELQHISYSGQLLAKFEMIRGALRVARFPSDVISRVEPIVPSASYGYRRRVTLHIDAQGKVGFYRESSRSVVPIESCPVSVPEIEQKLSTVRDFAREIQGKVTSLVLEADADGVVAVLKSPYALAAQEKQSVLNSAKKYFQNVTLMVGDKEVDGFGRQILELPLLEGGRFTLRVPAGSFSQINWEINTALIASTVELAQVQSGTSVLDLYSGAGNFALPLARAGGKVTAVECNERLAMFGRQNAERHSLDKQVFFYATSVEKYLAKDFKKLKPQVVVCDPPRSGLGKLVPEVSAKGEKFILISCHLPSFVRDLKALTDLGWQVETIRPFDMFAQTSYVEILCGLRR